jgi:uncharacterized protein (DUF924 family)
MLYHTPPKTEPSSCARRRHCAPGATAGMSLTAGAARREKMAFAALALVSCAVRRGRASSAASRRLTPQPRHLPYARRHAFAMSAHQRSPPEVVSGVLQFWFGEGSSRFGKPAASKVWFESSAEVDATIKDRFGADVEEATSGDAGKLGECGVTGDLALVILTDQFRRNMFRGTGKAFAGDKFALSIAARYYDDATARASAKERLSVWQRFFLYMPLMHAEDTVMVDKCVAAIEELRAESAAAAEAGDLVASECAKDVGGTLSFAARVRSPGEGAWRLAPDGESTTYSCSRPLPLCSASGRGGHVWPVPAPQRGTGPNVDAGGGGISRGRRGKVRSVKAALTGTVTGPARKAYASAALTAPEHPVLRTPHAFDRVRADKCAARDPSPVPTSRGAMETPGEAPGAQGAVHLCCARERAIPALAALPACLPVQPADATTRRCTPRLKASTSIESIHVLNGRGAAKPSGDVGNGWGLGGRCTPKTG